MGKSKEQIPLQRIDPFRWRIPESYNQQMRVADLVYANDELIEQIINDSALCQVINVANLPGIVGHSLGMPDIYWGSGFPVGGVVVTDAETGVISPGGIGFDINCGVRLLATELVRDQVCGQVERLADALFETLSSGVGGAGMRSAVPASRQYQYRQRYPQYRQPRNRKTLLKPSWYRCWSSTVPR